MTSARMALRRLANGLQDLTLDDVLTVEMDVSTLYGVRLIAHVRDGAFMDLCEVNEADPRLSRGGPNCHLSATIDGVEFVMVQLCGDAVAACAEEWE